VSEEVEVSTADSSDSRVDAICITILIAIIVVAAVYWVGGQ